MGADISAGLDVMAADIAREPIATRGILLDSLRRCRLEIRGTGGYPPRLTTPDILERCGIVYGADADSLEAVAAFDLVMQTAARFAQWRNGKCELQRWVGKAKADCATCSGTGMYIAEKEGHRFAYDCDCRMIEPIPELSQRVDDVVFRLGGWSIFKDLEPSKHPFVRRDFIAEFARWAKVEERRPQLPAGERSRLGTGMSRVPILSLPEAD